LYDLEGKIWVDPKQIKYIAINTISLDELQKHPYFKYTLSRVLINYRTQHGNYKNMESIKGVKLVNDSIAKLIAPYIHFK
jgi:DNA uptake protein ComE-like DNA-binding protein